MLGDKLIVVITQCLSGNCDWVDRLNSRFTALFLALCSLVITTKQLFGDPIDCIAVMSNALSTQQYRYADNLCWANYTMQFDLDKHLSTAYHSSQYYKITYYQWVHVFLVAQAALFLLPGLLWNGVSNGVFPFSNLISTLASEASMDPASRDNKLSHAAENLHRLFHCRTRGLILPPPPSNKLHSKDPYRTVNNHAPKKLRKRVLASLVSLLPNGCFLTYWYMLVKTLYMVNILVQFYIMELFIGPRLTYFYGLHYLMSGLWPEEYRFDSQHRVFPLVTFCDIELAVENSHQRKDLRTLQCVLTLNMLNEQIFFYIWVVLVVVGLVTMCNYLSWLYCITMRCAGVRLIRDMLFSMRGLSSNPIDRNSDRAQRQVEHFVQHYLCLDGVFIVRMVSCCTNTLFASELCSALHARYTRFLSQSARRTGLSDLEDSCHEDSDLSPRNEKKSEIKFISPPDVENLEASAPPPSNGGGGGGGYGSYPTKPVRSSSQLPRPFVSRKGDSGLPTVRPNIYAESLPRPSPKLPPLPDGLSSAGGDADRPPSPDCPPGHTSPNWRETEKPAGRFIPAEEEEHPPPPLPPVTFLPSSFVRRGGGRPTPGGDAPSAVVTSDSEHGGTTDGRFGAERLWNMAVANERGDTNRVNSNYHQNICLPTTDELLARLLNQ